MMKGLVWCVLCTVCALSGCNFEDGVLENPPGESAQDQGTMAPGDMATSRPDMMVDMTMDLGIPVVDLSVMLDQGEPVDQEEAPDQRMDMPDQSDMTPPVDQGNGMAMCGNGVLEAGELCDGNCPASCDDGEVCTSNVRAGQDATCNVLCSYPVISACTSGDGCCPSTCTHAQDQDCPPSDTPDCADNAAWPSTWKNIEVQSQQQIDIRRTSGQCNGMNYSMATSLSTSQPLTQAARCMAIWKKNNPGAPPNVIRSQLFVELMNAGYMVSGVQLLGAGGSSVPGVQAQLTSSDPNCINVTDPSFVSIGLGYVDTTVGNPDHVLMMILGE